MQKYLIAVVCNSSVQSRNVSRLLCNFLNVEHRSMLAPVIDAIHVATGMEKNRIAQDNTPFEIVPIVESTINNLKNRFLWALTTCNPSYLVDSFDKWLNDPDEKKNRDIFTGVAVTDISSDHQADYFRKNKGLVIHIMQEGNQLSHPSKPRDQDFVITLNNSDPVDREAVFEIAQRIKGLYKAHLQRSLFDKPEAA